MFIYVRCLLRMATSGELKSHLSRLRAAGRAGESQIRQRRALLRGTRQRRHQQVKDAGLSSRRSTSSTGADCSSKLRDMLPRNDLLESAIALTISENRDARTELEFMRHFMVGSLLSLASPVGIWDPYDVQPQVFALDKYIALPVFTSVDYLRLFCRRFRFTVRDPSGVLWADGPAEAAEEEQNGGAACTLPLPDVMASEWWARHVRRQSSNTLSGATEMCATRRGPLLAAAGVPVAEEITAVNEHNHRTCCMGADELFNYLESQPVETDGKAQNMGKRRKKGKKVCRVGMRGRKGTLERRDVPGGEEARGNRCRENEETIAAFWAKVRSTAPFQIKQATPLPTFGPLLHSFFVGYFADTETLLHNASIVPEKVDIVLNPASPIEFVLAREATDRVLQKDQLLLLAYRRVERELCGEFHRFFCLFAPEVLWARSACVPSPVPGTDKEVGYEVVILVQSEDPEFTLSSLRAAKARCLLMGHADLHILPWAAAAPHVQEASVVFYERAACSKGAGSSNRGELGVFEQRGPVQTINVARPADNFFHDPSAAYTESHAVFTEELKVRRRML
ncbi:hypothetical protein, conserved [Trypanosoma brucei gambiense DAL972]|uniref:Uncharacterized protein n=2 Tax=Trypanosoma brucei TaxID=5691 RepID=C9ZLK9_TRYB9|nr:hypothetical protein, conserved [Trypanosoma brucei gambiense DAL972]RHW73380.1 hypothetical protein DPX39_030049800 [Trypanosoma brucei equiperdum]CBH10218.1 hypothetical protein, conserved [Trypanosoma brucei gambiense DAL972]|eukprot:XP_011772508.1 hypothetical protein, conserved [Trypanosoma brucei gambiense DAL972]